MPRKKIQLNCSNIFVCSLITNLSVKIPVVVIQRGLFFYDFNKGDLIEKLENMVAIIKMYGLKVWLMIRGMFMCKINFNFICSHLARWFVSPIHYWILDSVMLKGEESSGDHLISKNWPLPLESLIPSKN